MRTVFAFIQKVIGGAASAASHGHTVETAQAAAARVEAAFDKAHTMSDNLFTALAAAKSARVATIAAIHADIAAFDAIRNLL